MVAVLAIYLSKLAFPTVYTQILDYIRAQAPQWGRYIWELAAQALEYGGWLGAVGVMAAASLVALLRKALRD
jgi:hypothetical protein